MKKNTTVFIYAETNPDFKDGAFTVPFYNLYEARSYLEQQVFHFAHTDSWAGVRKFCNYNDSNYHMVKEPNRIWIQLHGKNYYWNIVPKVPRYVPYNEYDTVDIGKYQICFCGLNPDEHGKNVLLDTQVFIIETGDDLEERYASDGKPVWDFYAVSGGPESLKGFTEQDVTELLMSKGVRKGERIDLSEVREEFLNR